MTTHINPPFMNLNDFPCHLHDKGYGVLLPQQLFDLSQIKHADLQAFEASWHDLALDGYLKDGGRYRKRRHSCFVVEQTQVTQVPHRAHWQPLVYNALHGGMERLFEPMDDAVTQSATWAKLLIALANLCHSAAQPQRWFVEAHQFRIDTADGIGRPTPEGAHRDGVDFVAVLVVGRQGIKGGETRVFEAHGSNGQRFTLTQPWTVLFMDDEKVVHESTPIQPLSDYGYRDTLVLTFRKNGFQASNMSV